MLNCSSFATYHRNHPHHLHHLQVISILKGAFRNAGLDLYLCPYGCIPTGYGRGVIEVVPHTKSR